MDEVKKENIMSVELAIQRELAYRKKVASLQSHSDVNSVKDLLPLQVPSSSLIQGSSLSSWLGPNSSSSHGVVTSSSYQVPSSSPSPSLNPWLGPYSSSSPSLGASLSHQGPSQAPIPSPMPFSRPIPNPRLGPQPISNPLPFSRPNLNSRTGPRPIPNSLPFPSRFPSSRPGPHPTSSPGPTHPRASVMLMKKKATTSNLQIKSQQQQQRPSQYRNSYVTIDQVGNNYCKACKVQCSGAITFKQHLRGHKHKAKLIALKMHSKGQTSKPKVGGVDLVVLDDGEEEREGSRKPWCELCEIWCMDQDSFGMHLKGKNHILRLHEFEAKNKAEEERSYRI